MVNCFIVGAYVNFCCSLVHSGEGNLLYNLPRFATKSKKSIVDCQCILDIKC